MEKFISQDLISKEILNSANLLKNINLNALIIGNDGVGKRTLAKYILNKAKIYDALELQKDIQDEIIQKEKNEFIVSNIENLTNIDLFLNWIEKNNIRIIATTSKNNLNEKLKSIFSINLEIQDLIKRPKDSQELIQFFSKEASKVLNVPFLEKDKLLINLENNTHSLRKSIYFSYLFETIGKSEILLFLEKYFKENLDEDKTYKDLMYLFEVPLIKAATKKYKSQVQIAKKLGINRITLRKKIQIYKELL